MAAPSPSTPRVSPCVFPPGPDGCHCGRGLWVSPQPCASRWPCPLGHHRSRGPIPRASHHGFILVGITTAICLSHTLLWLCPHGHRCGCAPHMHLAMAVALTHLPVAMSLWASPCPCPLRGPHCGCVPRGPCPSHVPRTHLAMSVSPWASLWPCSSPWLCPHRLLCSPVPMSCAAAMSALRHPHVCDPPVPCHSPCEPCCCQLLCTLCHGHVLHSHHCGGGPCGHRHLHVSAHASAQPCPGFAPAEPTGSSALRLERSFLSRANQTSSPRSPDPGESVVPGGLGGSCALWSRARTRCLLTSPLVKSGWRCWRCWGLQDVI